MKILILSLIGLLISVGNTVLTAWVFVHLQHLVALPFLPVLTMAQAFLVVSLAHVLTLRLSTADLISAEALKAKWKCEEGSLGIYTGLLYAAVLLIGYWFTLLVFNLMF